MTINVPVAIGDHVFLQEGGEEIGAVRQVEREHLVIYIEGAGDFTIRSSQVGAAHDSKVVLIASELEPALLAAAQHAHDKETE